MIQFYSAAKQKLFFFFQNIASVLQMKIKQNSLASFNKIIGFKGKIYD